MSDRPAVYLHIGTPKSGTSYLQRVLRSNRAALREDGVLHPQTSHYHAALDLRQLRMAGYADPRTAGAWRRLVDEIRDWHGTAVVSHELFAGTRTDLVAKAFDDLAFADVHVVLTMRTMARTLPAAWQERVKLGGTETFADFVAAVRHAPPAGGARWTDASHKFWNLQNVPAVLQKWGAHVVDPGHVHVIPVPPPSADLSAGLWARFGCMLGIDPLGPGYRITSEPANRSMGAVETAVLRRFNEALGRDYPWEIYSPLVKGYLAGRFSTRTSEAIGLSAADLAWAGEWTAQTVGAVAERGYHAIGRLEETTQAPTPIGVDPDSVSMEEQLSAAVDGMAIIARYVAKDSSSHDATTTPVLRGQLRRSRGTVLTELRRAVAEVPSRELVRRGVTALRSSTRRGSRSR